MVVTRAPIPALRPFVKLLWASDEDPTRLLKGPARELVLPTGAMHLVVRLSDHPLRLYAERPYADVSTSELARAKPQAAARPYVRPLSTGDAASPPSIIGVADSAFRPD